ncbi:hypothetical protein [Sphingomonas sp. RT2P30]|uniref:hypothetical protein n=1 Tax=Parasphingomonas halimpatiens TaxID=3096162 RepID=UPI002FCA3A5D
MTNQHSATGVPPHDVPMDAVAEQGFVLVDGPDGVAVTLTPKAASGSAQSIAQAASDAAQQKPEDPPPAGD